MVGAIPSPCTGVCAIDRTTQVCTGCRRTLDEIARWGSGSDDDRRAILAAVSRRKR